MDADGGGGGGGGVVAHKRSMMNPLPPPACPLAMFIRRSESTPVEAATLTLASIAPDSSACDAYSEAGPELSRATQKVSAAKTEGERVSRTTWV